MFYYKITSYSFQLIPMFIIYNNYRNEMNNIIIYNKHSNKILILIFTYFCKYLYFVFLYYYTDS